MMAKDNYRGYDITVEPRAGSPTSCWQAVEVKARRERRMATAPNGVAKTGAKALNMQGGRVRGLRRDSLAVPSRLLGTVSDMTR